VEDLMIDFDCIVIKYLGRRYLGYGCRCCNTWPKYLATVWVDGKPSDMEWTAGSEAEAMNGALGLLQLRAQLRP
jgi:hypothetical protein